MKTTISLLLLAGLSHLCAEGRLKVEIPADGPIDELVVAHHPISDFAGSSKSLSYDTITMADGYRLYDYDQAMCYYLNPPYQDYNNCRLIIAPEEDVTITIDNKLLSESTVTGSRLWDARKDMLAEQRSYLEKSTGDPTMARYKFNLNYALTHRDAPVSILALGEMPAAMASVAVDSINPEVRDGLLAPMYQRIASQVKDFLRQEAAKKGSVAGKPAHDFTLENPEGETISLSSLRGQWVLLDFWGTWCGWCIKGFPAMLDFTRRHGDLCTIVTLDCKDPKELWTEYVGSHDMPWINLWVDTADHTDANPMNSYGIEAMPTKILIDPEGTIRLTVQGHTDDFFDQVLRIIASS